MTAPDPRVRIFLGPGGVGKTTVAAAAGIGVARRGGSAMVLTVDPARRLADTLGTAANGVGNEPRRVEGPWSGQLWAAMLDPAATLEALVRTHGGADQAERVVDNRLFATISHSLTGLNEYMAAERLHELHRDDRFDQIIVDTPPSRHAVDFLDSPDRVRAFLDNPFYRRVLAPRRGLGRSVNLAAQMLVRRTARLVGADLLDDVIRLFADLDGLDTGFHERAIETSALLDGPDCAYTLVTSARRQPMAEARWIRDRLAERDKPIATYVVNRLTPSFGPLDTGAPDADGPVDVIDPLGDNRRQLAALVAQERALVAELTGDPDGATVVGVDERVVPPRTLDELVELAAELQPSAAA